MTTSAFEFEKIYATFQPKILRYLTGLAGEQDAEDLTQVVFEKVSSGLSGFRGEAGISTWIYRIATNTAADRVRSPLTRQEVGSIPIEESEQEQQLWGLAKPPTADQLLISREMNACIRGVVDDLPESFHTVLFLSEFEGMKNAEIAEILSVSLDTVKIRLHRARTQLKNELMQRCTFSHDERNELACDPKHCGC